MLSVIMTLDSAIGGGLYDLHHFVLNLEAVFESEEDGTQIGILGIGESGAILLLFFDGQFVPLDQPVLVIFNGSHGHDAVLFSVAHFLHINIHAFHCVLLDPFILSKQLQIISALLVYLFTI